MLEKRRRVVVITGAAGGVGRALLEAFHRDGDIIAAVDLPCTDVVDVTASLGGGHAAFHCDVASEDEVVGLVAAIERRFGRIDVLVNSAGVSARNAPPDWDWERVWDFVMAVNMKGTFLMCKAVVDQMVKQGGGSIVNLSSIYGLVGRPREIGNGLDPYLHSKGGVAQLTRDMAVHFAREGVRVNALCPGFVYTPLTKRLTDDPESLQLLVDKHPMGRLGQPAEIAAAALFLASDEASFVTGACIPVDGGYTAQ